MAKKKSIYEKINNRQSMISAGPELSFCSFFGFHEWNAELKRLKERLYMVFPFFVTPSALPSHVKRLKTSPLTSNESAQSYGWSRQRTTPPRFPKFDLGGNSAATTYRPFLSICFLYFRRADERGMYVTSFRAKKSKRHAFRREAAPKWMLMEREKERKSCWRGAPKPRQATLDARRTRA